MNAFVTNRKRSLAPTESELELLQVLWTHGPRSVRQIWETLGKRGAYTTILKLLQIMFEKGLVDRDESQQSHIYKAALGESEVQKTLVLGLMQRAFGGSPSKLLLGALSAKPVAPEELEQIRRLLEQARSPKSK